MHEKNAWEKNTTILFIYTVLWHISDSNWIEIKSNNDFFQQIYCQQKNKTLNLTNIHYKLYLMFFKEVYFAHQVCVYLIKNIIKNSNIVNFYYKIFKK